ncbi:MAG: DNA-directed RNA polymerase subunit A'' [Candidatus Nanoarchaeia archaeon]|nr:DNA-directed RNA polymerase subunit A'' [Candidatus Nanoarchaeia archaeon]
MLKINKEYEMLPSSILDETFEKAQKEGLTQKQFDNLLELISSEYNKIKVEVGEPVGLAAAQSIGEQGTQMTLNTFHFAGVAEMNVTTGLPRLIEILDSRKTLKSPQMKIYLNKEFENEKDVNKIVGLLKESLLSDVLDSIDIDMANFSLILNVNNEKMEKLDLTMKKIETLIKPKSKNVELKVDSNKIVFSYVEKSLEKLYQDKEKLKKIYISGVKGLNQVFAFKKNDGTYEILTSGINMKDVLAKDYVDKLRTRCNDINEVAKFFGIEAARQSIVEEAIQVIEEQGIEVDPRHIFLIADMMTYKGLVLGITRNGIVTRKDSVLLKASFETPIVHLLEAAKTGNSDKIDNISNNIMINQFVPVGTGSVELYYDTN